MLTRMRGVKRKLTDYADEEARLHDDVGARLSHLEELYGMHTVDDVKYEAWSRKRLDRLVVDYMLRKGFQNSAEKLAEDKGVQALVDVQTFQRQGKIVEELHAGNVSGALAWCADNKKELRKMESKLEFQLRFQQYIELLRADKLPEAITHLKKHLIPARQTHPTEVQRACGLLAAPPTNRGAEVYTSLYAPRWPELATLFTKTHHSLLSITDRPLLHIALSSGLSALKTPLCHAPQRNNKSQNLASPPPAVGGHRGVCPICSTELNDLAAHVPYAHHTKSHVLTDLRMFPDGRVRGRQQLLDEARKLGLPTDVVKNVADGKTYHIDDLKRAYIT